MSYTRITYRGSTLFVLGSIGTLILNIFVLIFCLGWLGIAILILSLSLDSGFDFMDIVLISIGTIVGIGGSALIIWSIKSEIRDIKIEHIEKKINKLEQKDSKLCYSAQIIAGIKCREEDAEDIRRVRMEIGRAIETLKNECNKLKQQRDLDNGVKPDNEKKQKQEHAKPKLQVPNIKFASGGITSAELIAAVNRKKRLAQQEAKRTEIATEKLFGQQTLSSGAPLYTPNPGPKEDNSPSATLLTAGQTSDEAGTRAVIPESHSSEDAENASERTKIATEKLFGQQTLSSGAPLYTPNPSSAGKGSENNPNTQEVVQKNVPFAANLAAAPRDEQGRVDYTKIENADELARVVTAEMEGDKDAVKDYLTMKKKAAESALKKVKHKDDEDSAAFLAVHKQEKALQKEVSRWDNALTALNTI